MTTVVPLADGCSPAWASAWGVDEYGVYAEFTIVGVVQRMRWLEAGTFLMGSPEDEAERSRDEVQHEVTLSRGYWVADTVCTQTMWYSIMRYNHSLFVGGQRPVEQVSWQESQEFLKRINREQPGLNLRLLTEAEWEYACRAGTNGPFSFGDNATPEWVNYDGNYPYVLGERGVYRRETVRVGTLPPNPWGLYEMHGNVWEWCADWYSASGREGALDPQGPSEAEKRVLRGGSWVMMAGSARSAYRGALEPDFRSNDVGFRFGRSHG